MEATPKQIRDLQHQEEGIKIILGWTCLAVALVSFAFFSYVKRQ
jgi:hypothetical protein